MTYTIGEVARMMNIAASTLRYYEKEGLLLPTSRSQNGQRVYTDDDIATLSIIEYLKFCGLPLKEIRSFNPMGRRSAPAARSWPESAIMSAHRSRRCKQSSNGWNSAAGIMRRRSSMGQSCRCMNFQRSIFHPSTAAPCGMASACRCRTCAKSSNGDKKEP